MQQTSGMIGALKRGVDQAREIETQSRRELQRGLAVGRAIEGKALQIKRREVVGEVRAATAQAPATTRSTFR
eukprot:9187453-Alexandrium_andersonii.AAC.1